MQRPTKSHPWRRGVRGPLRYSPLDGIERPVRILPDHEIRALGYTLLTADPAEIHEARRMCQRHHPDKGGDPVVFQQWKRKLDKLRRRI